MSVIVTNVDMPESCFKCTFHDGITMCMFRNSIPYTMPDPRYENCPLKEIPQDTSMDELRSEISTLQHRCYALTKGTMCTFCKYECEYKADRSKEDE